METRTPAHEAPSVPSQRDAPADERLRVLRVIARLNIGGPALHVDILSCELDPARFQTLLVSGLPDAREGERAPRQVPHVTWVRLSTLRRSIHPIRDLRATWTLFHLCQRFRPQVLHTHTAKAGAVGRLAGWLYNTVGAGRQPGRHCVIVHTFHGHVLDGYFSQRLSWLFSAIERWLARRTDCLIAVAEPVRQDLLVRRIGTERQVIVVPLGLHLEELFDLPFPQPAPELTVGIVGRLVPIKRHEVFLEAVACLLRGARDVRCRFLIVGDGPQREALLRYAQELGISQVVQFVGWQHDLARLYGSLDIVCLSSRQEGTPVSLIEALAAARAVVATDVGGVRELLGAAAAPSGKDEPVLPRDAGLTQYAHGLLVRSADPQAFAEAVTYLAANPRIRLVMGTQGRAFVQERFTAARLVRDVDHLYGRLVSRDRQHRMGAACML